MSVQETVRILREFEETEGETLRAQYGAEAVAVAEDLARVLDGRLQSESTRRGTISPYESLWPAFQADPVDVEPKLIGALEAMIEADPALGQRLNAFIEEFHRAIASENREEANLIGENVTATDVVPDTTITAGERYNQGEGEYLYGNVKGGAEALGANVGVTEVNPQEGARTRIRPDEAATVPEFFGHLDASIDTHPDLAAEEKSELHRALHQVQALMDQGEAADVSELKATLRRMGEISPDILDATLEGLLNFVSSWVDDVIDALREMHVRREQE
ncbi:MAG: hypothetical protein ACLFTI_07685 [Anaerolineales bacterium]